MLKPNLAPGSRPVNTAAATKEEAMASDALTWHYYDTTEGAVRWRIAIDGRGAPWLPDTLVCIVWARDAGEAMAVARAIYARSAAMRPRAPSAFLWSGSGIWTASRIEEERP